MATYYYDFVSGNNGNAGTDINAPKQTFGTNVTLVAGDIHLFKRGVTWSGVLNLVRIGIVGNTGGSATNRAYLGAYGTGAKPIISGVNNTVAPIWVRHGSFITIEDLQVTASVASGILVQGNSGSENPTDITLRGCVAFGNNTASTAGIDGITIQKAGGAALTSNILIENCVAYDNNGHGIKARQGSSRVTMRKCWVYRNGLTTASHGLGTAGTRIVVTGWTLVSGTIYSTPLTPASYGETAAITALDAVWADFSPHYSLTNAGVSATPAAGEFSVPSNNLLYVNIGQNPTGVTVEACKSPPRYTLIEDCIAELTNDTNGQEGHGIGIDDYSMDTTVSRCISRNNEGKGMTYNKNSNSTASNCLMFGNAAGPIAGYYGTGTRAVYGCTLVVASSDLLSSCIDAGGKSTITAKNNVFIGGKAGIWMTSSIIDAVVESNNSYSRQSVASVRLGATTPSLTNAITTDPLLTTDYKPTASSPLLGAGTHLGYTRDVDRKQRQNPPAIGAYDAATMRVA